MTAAGTFDEAAFRAYVAGKLANITTALQTYATFVQTYGNLHPKYPTLLTAVHTHISSRLDGCLTAEDMAAKNVSDIFFYCLRSEYLDSDHIYSK